MAEAKSTLTREDGLVVADEISSSERQQCLVDAPWLPPVRLAPRMPRGRPALPRRLPRSRRARRPVADRGERRGEPGSSRAPRQSRRSRPSSSRSASISSTKSGFPPAASTIRSRAGSLEIGAGKVVEKRRALGVGERLEANRRRVGLPPPHCRRRSSNSGRATQTSRTGASLVQSVTWSTRSRNVGSPQWMSSKTMTSGRRRASVSTNVRTARNVSSTPLTPVGEPDDLAQPLCDKLRVVARLEQGGELREVLVRGRGVVEHCSIAHGFEHGPVRDSLAVRKAPATRDEGVGPRRPRRTHARGATSRRQALRRW